MVSIVLVEPENSSNIGSIARVMANFDVRELILVNPKASHLKDEALFLAKHAKHILKKAKVRDYSYFEKTSKESVFRDFSYVIATTSVIGSDDNLTRLPLSPREAAAKVSAAKTAIVFGREGTGLTNEEIMRCSFAVTIPSSREYPAMNISHSAAIILYEMYLEAGENRIGSHIAPATGKERDIIQKKIGAILDKIEFSTPEKKETQKNLWNRVMEKAVLTRREAFGVMGFLRKIEGKLK